MTPELLIQRLTVPVEVFLTSRTLPAVMSEVVGSAESDWKEVVKLVPVTVTDVVAPMPIAAAEVRLILLPVND